ncbi:MAG: PhnD/SsuA/transferrin family substrate-binding protein [Gallionella sp.]|nr:PhnD/SsuA/transferrin family substrate-binding protein [Gallionella sp.]MDD4958618.1 PhnD/SsuA/transferrin family substrate-binding protein [Gallionella sp.]
MAESLILHFATYASERPSEEYKKMDPFHLYLEKQLAKQGVNVQIKMRIFPTYEEAIEAVVSGKADFSRLGPVSYVMAKMKNQDIQLIAMESSHGENFFNGVIFVATDSAIRKLSDLKGKRFAFGEENSTTGRYLAQEVLLQAGITARDLAGYDFIGRHDKVAFAVAAGNYDAGAANETTLQKYGQAKGLRQIVTFQSPTHAWVGRAGLATGIVEQLQKAMFRMKGDDLEYIGRDGFLPAKDTDFDGVRRSMLKIKGFDD